MPPFTVTVTKPPPPRVTLEMDLDTARALKALTGIGLIHLREPADDVARRAGFDNGMGDVLQALVTDAVWDRLNEVL